MTAPFNPFFGQRIKTNVNGMRVPMRFLAQISFTAAEAVGANNTSIHADIALTNAAQEINTGLSNPPVARSMIVKGNAAGIAGNVVIQGTNIAGDPISETLALNGATAVEGNFAFRTVVKVTVPAQTHAGDTVSVGRGEKLGLPYKLQRNTVLLTMKDNVAEITAPTVTVDATKIEANTIKLASGLNSKQIDAFLIV